MWTVSKDYLPQISVFTRKLEIHTYWAGKNMCLIFCLRKASRDVPQFKTVLHPDEPIIHGKYRKSKMHFIHFTYSTPSLSVTVLKCSQNTRSTTGWQHSVSCDRGAAWELLPTARCRCPGWEAAPYCISPAQEKVKIQNLKNGFYWVHIACAPW